MDRRVTSPTWGPSPPCKQALRGNEPVNDSWKELKHRKLIDGGLILTSSRVAVLCRPSRENDLASMRSIIVVLPTDNVFSLLIAPKQLSACSRLLVKRFPFQHSLAYQLKKVVKHFMDTFWLYWFWLYCFTDYFPCVLKRSVFYLLLLTLPTYSYSYLLALPTYS